MVVEIYKPGGEQGSGEEGGTGVYGETQARQSVWIFCKKARCSGNKLKIISSWAHRQWAGRLVSKFLLSCMAKFIVLPLIPVCWDLSVPGWGMYVGTVIAEFKELQGAGLSYGTMVIQKVSAVNRLTRVMETTVEHTANVFISSCYLSPLEKYWATLKGFSLYSQSVRAKLSVLGCWESVDTQRKRRRNTQNFMNFSFLTSWLGRTPLKRM